MPWLRGYSEVKMDAMEGSVHDEVEYEFINKVPCRAMLSMKGEVSRL
jgi:hypothetical protein